MVLPAALRVNGEKGVKVQCVQGTKQKPGFPGQKRHGLQTQPPLGEMEGFEPSSHCRPTQCLSEDADE